MKLKYPFEYGTDLKLYQKTAAQITDLNDLLTEMFNEDEELQQYVNCIAVCNRDTHLSISSYKKIMTNQLEENPESREYLMNCGHREFDHRKFDTISFMNLGIAQLKEVCREERNTGNGRSANSADDKMYKIFNPQVNTANSLANKIYNICPEMKGIKGTFTNFNQLRSALDDVIKDSYSFNMNNITEYILFGTRDIVLAVIKPSGHLLVKWSVINSLLINDRAKAKEVLVALFARFNYFNERIKKANITTFKEDIEDSAFFECYRRFMTSLNDEHSFFPAKVDGNNVFRIEDVLSSQLETVLKDQFQGTIFSVNDESMYYTMLKDVFENFKNNVDKATKKAYRKGMEMSNKMAMLGWQVVDKSQVPGGGKDGVVWYRKELNIVPDRYEKNKKVYKIHEDKRSCCKIPNLFVSTDGEVRADSAHPNVHGCTSKVCTGDMEKLDFAWTGDKIRDWLGRLETLLTMMNFDSPHHDKLYKTVKVNAELMTALTTNDSETEEKKKEAGKGVRKLTMDAEADDEVEEEVVVEVVADVVSEMVNDEPNFSDEINLNTDENPEAEVIQLRGQNGNVYNGQEFENPSIADPDGEYLEVFNDLRQRQREGNEKKIIRDQNMPKSHNRIRFKLRHRDRAEFGIFLKGTGCIYYFKHDHYYSGVKIKSSDFERLLHYAIKSDMISNQIKEENLPKFSKFISENMRRKFGLPEPLVDMSHMVEEDGRQILSYAETIAHRIDNEVLATVSTEV
jgi:hypothetical protein